MKTTMKTRHHDKTIVLTGGGSTGHVSVNLALIPGLLADGWSVHYIGSKDGIERSLIEPLKGVTYHEISTGKLRRYWDKRNLSDMLRVGKGLVQATALLRRLRPNIVFSKGGFVSVPVVLGAKLNRIPAIIHESDVTPGLANRIAIPCATAVCTTFPETAAYIRGARVVQVGPLVRPELYNGDAERGRKLCGFDRSRPVLLVMGGSLGSRRLNEAITEALPELLPRWQIVHLRGKGQVASEAAVAGGGSAASGAKEAGGGSAEASLAAKGPGTGGGATGRSATGRLTVSGLATGGSMTGGSATSDSVVEPGYRSFEYLSEELPDVLALADAVLTRAGANALFEMLALRKPMLLVPLPLSQSRGDQLRNAASFEAAGLARVLPEEKLSTVTLMQELRALTTGDPDLQDRLIAAAPADPLPQLHDLIRETAKGRS
ncbi:Glycosyltransferase family 28 C-terminal domain-containing protein [Paenibacillaceae bacterium GAS479]|nr:Glycosyltransferase family 28 C-terminal domain-containing protein [Paenibacillaceae bacterium GAS479]